MARIKYRQGTRQEWIDANPVLDVGEPAYETDTKKQKIGDGYTRWIDLRYFADPVDGAVTQEQLLTHVNDPDPHPNYDDGSSFVLLYENAKV